MDPKVLAAGTMLLVGLSGCLATSTEPAGSAPPEAIPTTPGLFSVDATGIEPRSELPGLIVEGTTYRWDPLPYIEQDTMAFLLLQAMANTQYTIVSAEHVEFATEPDSSLQPRETACAASLFGPSPPSPSRPLDPVHGDYLLARAQGLPVKEPAGLPRHGIGYGAVYGPSGGAPGVPQGSVGSGFEFKGTVGAGEWMIVGVGLSGLSAAAAGEGSTLATEVQADAPMVVYALPPTTLYCGSGFSYLENSTVHAAGPPGYHVGGALDFAAAYGKAFVWDGACHPGSGDTTPLDKASITFDGNETALTQDTPSLMLGTFSTGPARLAVEQWKGYPLWLFVGFPLEPEPRSRSPSFGCLG